MSKLLVVKQDAKAFNAYFADDSTQGYYRVSDCVPIDIDNLEIEYRFRYCKPTMIDGTLCFTYHRKFSEFLQERMI